MAKEEGVAATEAKEEDRMSERGSTYTVKLYAVNMQSNFHETLFWILYESECSQAH